MERYRSPHLLSSRVLRADIPGREVTPATIRRWMFADCLPPTGTGLCPRLTFSSLPADCGDRTCDRHLTRRPKVRAQETTMLAFIYGVPGWAEILIVLFIALLLFGKRLPSTMRSLGASIVEFKKGVRGAEEDGDNTGTPKEEPRKVDAT
jgi:sec-independent protein translocase protein TatA